MTTPFVSIFPDHDDDADDPINVRRAIEAERPGVTAVPGGVRYEQFPLPDAAVMAEIDANDPFGNDGLAEGVAI